MGSLSNKNGDGNKDSKKATGLCQQNNNFARASHFFVHFLAVVASLQHETSLNVTHPLYGVGEHSTEIFFLFLNSDTVLSDSINPRQFCQDFTNEMSMKLNKIDEV